MGRVLFCDNRSALDLHFHAQGFGLYFVCENRTFSICNAFPYSSLYDHGLALPPCQLRSGHTRRVTLPGIWHLDLDLQYVGIDTL
jgi:hypothetical protein